MGPAGCLLSCRSLQEFPMVLAAASGVLDATAQPRSRIGAEGAEVAVPPQLLASILERSGRLRQSAALWPSVEPRSFRLVGGGAVLAYARERV